MARPRHGTRPRADGAEAQRQRIISLIQVQPSTLERIADQTGIPLSSVKRRVRELQEEGRIVTSFFAP